MGRESSQKPGYEIIAYITQHKERVLGGTSLSLFASDEDQLNSMTSDIAKAMKADVVRMKNGDYLVIRV
ncbi:hypothetical protein KO561_05685 [Radiobacillus kanasensis]|uniref:capping complex subunit for YIEGIA n=1 Tax=Radiobacillus kanasensis TaxID=2844358 RepID=UPI001E588D3A|nr:hypothetical protein [Radiobacillus kanasensis]UFU00437.1 hypothetical protein KO561_05685 [Radiobacillus kanasensis]